MSTAAPDLGKRIFAASETMSFIPGRVPASTDAVRLLRDHAGKLGYRETERTLGMRYEGTANMPILPPPDADASSANAAQRKSKPQPIEKIEFDLIVQDLEHVSDPARDAAILTATIRAPGTSEPPFTFEILLECRNWDRDGTFVEYEVVDGRIAEAKSWWTAARACVLRSCSGICIGALTACSGTWAAYLACVAVACGGCWLRCAACATCNCGWLCKPLVGCCRQ